MARDLELKLRITADGRIAIEQIDQTAEAVDMLGKEAADSASALDRIVERGRNVGILALGFNELAELLGRISGPLRNIAELADQYRNLATRIELVAGPGAEAARVMDEIGRIAQRSHAPLATVGELHVRIAQALKESGRSQQEILGVTQALSDAILVSGANAAEASSAMIQLAQESPASSRTKIRPAGVPSPRRAVFRP